MTQTMLCVEKNMSIYISYLYCIASSCSQFQKCFLQAVIAKVSLYLVLEREKQENTTLCFQKNIFPIMSGEF